jgi:hypothetical protein
LDSAPGAAYSYDYAHSRWITNKRSMKLRLSIRRNTGGRRHFLHRQRRRNQSKLLRQRPLKLRWIRSALYNGPVATIRPINAPTHTDRHRRGVDCGIQATPSVRPPLTPWPFAPETIRPDVQPPDIFQQIKAFPLANFFGREVGRQSRRIGHSNRQEPVTIDN